MLVYFHTLPPPPHENQKVVYLMGRHFTSQIRSLRRNDFDILCDERRDLSSEEGV